MNILDPQTIAELIGGDINPDEPFGPGAENILAWAKRTFPDSLDHYSRYSKQ